MCQIYLSDAQNLVDSFDAEARMRFRRPRLPVVGERARRLRYARPFGAFIIVQCKKAK